MSRDFSEIYPWLLLGPNTYIHNNDWIENNKITHILSICSPNKRCNIDNININHLQLFLEDNADGDIDAIIDRAVEFIKDVEDNGGKIYVHCTAGISRSPTIIIAYLLLTKKYKLLDDAYLFVGDRRSCMDPNIGFIMWLEDLKI